MVGQVSASGGLQTQLVQNNGGQIVGQAVQGLGDAVTRLANTGLGYLASRSEIEKVYDQREQTSQSLALDTQFLEYQQERAKEYADMARERSAAPLGMTREYDALLGQREKEFLATVPPRHREEYVNRLAQDRATRVGSAFRGELELLDTADSATLNRGLNTLGSNLKGQTVSLEDAQVEWESLVAKSGLPAITKQEFIENGKATLQALSFGTEVEYIAKGYGAVGDGSNGDVVAAGLSPQERGVLNGISSEESPGYDVWNGGTKFTGYADHPARTNDYPGESTAAGKYQFILSTWDAATAAYEKTYGVHVPDFSPEWQDRVALFWAEKRFNELNNDGLTFRGVLASGDPAQLLILKKVLGEPRGGNALAVEWQGLGPMSDEKFLAIFNGEKGIAGGGTGAPDLPNIWTDQRYSSLTLDQKIQFGTSAAAAAESYRQGMATQNKQQRESFLNDVYNAGYSGDPRAADIFRTLPEWDAEAESKFKAGQEVFRNSEAGVAQVSNILAEGKGLPSGRAGDYAKWFGEDSLAGLAAGEKAAYDKLAWAVERARLLPEGSSASFKAAMASPATQGTALQFLGAAHAGDPSLLKRSGWSDADIADVQLYTNIARRSGSAETALNDYRLAKDASVRLGKTPAALAKEANDFWVETYSTPEDVVGDLFDPWFGGQPVFPKNSNVNAQFMQDAGSAFQDGYKIYGTADGAKAYMESYLKLTWGATKTRTSFDSSYAMDDNFQSVMMKYPPEMAYGQEGDDFGLLYDSIGQYALANGAPETGAILMADDTTDAEVRAGKLPTYRVIGRGEAGEAILLPGRFGGEEIKELMDKPKEQTAEQNIVMARVTGAQELYAAAQLALYETEKFGATGDFGVLRQKVVEAEKAHDKMLDEAVAAGYMSKSAAALERNLRGTYKEPVPIVGGIGQLQPGVAGDNSVSVPGADSTVRSPESISGISAAGSEPSPVAPRPNSDLGILAAQSRAIAGSKNSVVNELIKLAEGPELTPAKKRLALQKLRQELNKLPATEKRDKLFGLVQGLLNETPN